MEVARAVNGQNDEIDSESVTQFSIHYDCCVEIHIIIVK